MTAPRTAAPTAKTIRIIYAAMVTGVLLFGLVAHFVMRPTIADSGDIPVGVLRLLLGLGLGACVVSLLLRGRVPQRASDESADLFWMRAATPAMVTWAPLEAACLLGVFLYGNTGSASAMGVAAVAVVLFVILNPAYLERR
jgi:hypothetical protein